MSKCLTNGILFFQLFFSDSVKSSRSRGERLDNNTVLSMMKRSLDTLPEPVIPPEMSAPVVLRARLSALGLSSSDEIQRLCELMGSRIRVKFKRKRPVGKTGKKKRWVPIGMGKNTKRTKKKSQWLLDWQRELREERHGLTSGGEFEEDHGLDKDEDDEEDEDEEEDEQDDEGEEEEDRDAQDADGGAMAEGVSKLEGNDDHVSADDLMSPEEQAKYEEGLYFEGKSFARKEGIGSSQKFHLRNMEVRIRFDGQVLLLMARTRSLIVCIDQNTYGKRLPYAYPSYPLPHMNRAVVIHQMNQALEYAKRPEQFLKEELHVR